MLTPYFATVFDFNISPHMIAIVVPIAAMIFGGVMAISAMYFKHQKQAMWHETARIALEKGQPLPVSPDDDERPRDFRRHERNDLRGGIMLIAVSTGIFVFLRAVDAGEAAYIAAIPGFIGVALLLFGLIATFVSKTNSRPDDRSR